MEVPYNWGYTVLGAARHTASNGSGKDQDASR